MREEFGKLVSYTIDENIVNIAYEKNIDIIQGLDIEIVKEQKERMEKVMDIKILTIHTTCSVI